MDDFKQLSAEELSVVKGAMALFVKEVAKSTVLTDMDVADLQRALDILDFARSGNLYVSYKGDNNVENQ